MSLAAFALRTCTVRALRGATLAGAAVVDSPVDMSDIAEKAATPTIFVFSDMERLSGMGTRAVLAGDATVDLALMIVLPAVFQATVNGTTVEFQDRKAGAAAAIDIIYRQVERALLDGSTVWSQLWCRFVLEIHNIEAQAYVLPVGSGATQRKLPARAIRIVVEPLDAPPFGVAAQDAWADLLAAMAGDKGLAPIAPLIAAAIQGDALPDWRVDAVQLGDTAADAIAVGYGPLGGTAADAIVPMTEATLNFTAPGAPDPSITIVEGEPASDEP